MFVIQDMRGMAYNVQVKYHFCTCRFTFYPGLMKRLVHEEGLQGQKIQLLVMEGTPFCKYMPIQL